MNALLFILSSVQIHFNVKCRVVETKYLKATMTTRIAVQNFDGFKNETPLEESLIKIKTKKLIKKHKLTTDSD